jgi:hypothetical protein
MGNEVHPTFHGRVRSRELDLRLHHLLGHALAAPRRSRRVQDRLVCRIDRYPDPRRLRDPDPAGPVLQEQAQSAHDSRANRGPLVGAILPYTGLANLLGFTPLPGQFFLILFGMVVVYLFLVELAKTRFYRAPHAKSPRIASTHIERLERRIKRRAFRFIHHPNQRSANEVGGDLPASRSAVGN